MGNLRVLQILFLVVLGIAYCTMPPSYSRTAKRTTATKHVASKTSTKKVASKRVPAKKVALKTGSTKKVASKKNSHAKSRVAHVTSKKRKTVKVAHGRKKTVKVASAKRKPRYAYPAEGFFIWSPPQAALSPMPRSMTKSMRTAFNTGMASRYSPQALVQAGVFTHEPLYGGIFKRREDVKYIILHSTETERPASGPRVIKSWNHGMRHPGAQYVVDRDGTIYQTVDPEYGTVHVDIFRTLNGINNDNAIGIEMVRAGKQKYTADQLESVTKLVSYLQGHFNVADNNVYGHGQIQPSTRTDPVAFDWNNFYSSMTSLRGQVMALKGKTRS